MTRKTFAIVAVAGLAALAALAAGLRPSSGIAEPTAYKSSEASVETTVVHPGSTGEVKSDKSSPRPVTSPSATGGDDDKAEHEDDHEVEHAGGDDSDHADGHDTDHEHQSDDGEDD